jgi:hypothetical protein
MIRTTVALWGCSYSLTMKIKQTIAMNVFEFAAMWFVLTIATTIVIVMLAALSLPRHETSEAPRRRGGERE